MDEDSTEAFEEDPSVSGTEEGMGTRQDSSLQHQNTEHMPPLDKNETGMSDHAGASGGMIDKMDKLSPQERATLKELLGKMI